MAEIMVRGQAEERLAPTSASLTVVVRVLSAKGQSDAVDRAAERCQAVDAQIEQYRGSLITGAVDFSVRTGQEWDYSGKEGRRLVGHYATRSTEVDCEPDGEALTTFLHAVGGIKEVSVDGPNWVIAPDATGWDGLRLQAAADARRKATAYAVGLGMAVGRVAWIAEVGLRRPGGSGSGPGPDFAAQSAPMKRSGRVGGGNDSDDQPLLVRVHPEPIRVTATVEVGFNLADG